MTILTGKLENLKFGPDEEGVRLETPASKSVHSGYVVSVPRRCGITVSSETKSSIRLNFRGLFNARNTERAKF